MFMVTKGLGYLSCFSHNGAPVLVYDFRRAALYEKAEAVEICNGLNPKPPKNPRTKGKEKWATPKKEWRILDQSKVFSALFRDNKEVQEVISALKTRLAIAGGRNRFSTFYSLHPRHVYVTVTNRISKQSSSRKVKVEND